MAEALHGGEDTAGKECYVYSYSSAEITKFGLESGAKSYIYDNGDNSLNRTISASGLTSSITKPNEAKQTVTWKISVTGLNNAVAPEGTDITGYSYVFDSDNSSCIIYPLTDMKVYIEPRSGADTTNKDWLTKWTDECIKRLGLLFNDGSDQSGLDRYDTASLQNFFKENYNSDINIKYISAETEDNPGYIYLTGIPYFSKSKSLITYCVVIKPDTDGSNIATLGDNNYKIEYDNTVIA